MSVDWQEGMSVGVEEIDVHHRQIMRRVRHLANAVSSGSAREIRGALGFLHGYLSEHNAAEERWMDEAGYPAAKEHARAHAGVLERIRIAREDVAAGSEGRLIAAADSIARVLDVHMRLDDVKLGRFWTARQNLRLLAEKGPGVGACLTPIPGMHATVSPVGAPGDVSGEDDDGEHDDGPPPRGARPGQKR